MKLRDLSTSVLRATLFTFTRLRIYPEQRQAIAHELVVRALAEVIEERLPMMTRWMRGGNS